MNVVIRSRAAGDAGALLTALRPVHETDGYPLHPHHLTTRWIYEGMIEAWVAEVGGVIVGHAALALATGDVPRLTRFFVTPGARGSGAGSALLEAIEAWADERRTALTLDVVEHNVDAQRLYEHRGWQHTDTVPATWVRDSGPWPNAFVYRRPATGHSAG